MNAIEAYYAGRQEGEALGFGFVKHIEIGHIAPEQRAFVEGLADGVFEARLAKVAARSAQGAYLDTIARQDGDRFTSLAKTWEDEPL